MIRTVTGFLFAAALLPALYYGWPYVQGLLRQRWARDAYLSDVRIILGVVLVFALLWLAEKLWTWLDTRLFADAKHEPPSGGS